MSAAVAETTPRPEIPATRTLRRLRRDPQNGLHGVDLTRSKISPAADDVRAVSSPPSNDVR
jgi:hypothetical protein